MGLHDSPGSPKSTLQKRLGPDLDEADDGPLIDGEGKYGKRYKVGYAAVCAIAAPRCMDQSPCASTIHTTWELIWLLTVSTSDCGPSSVL